MNKHTPTFIPDSRVNVRTTVFLDPEKKGLSQLENLFRFIQRLGEKSWNSY